MYYTLMLNLGSNCNQKIKGQVNGLEIELVQACTWDLLNVKCVNNVGALLAMNPVLNTVLNLYFLININR